MISLPLTGKTLRGYAVVIVGAHLLLCAFAALYMVVTASVPIERSLEMLNLEWVRSLLAALLGSDVGSQFTPNGVTAFFFVHPLMWTLVVATLITVSTGVMAGEVDRGTMDLLASLPISRARQYGSHTVVLVALGIPFIAAILTGIRLGLVIKPQKEIEFWRLAIVGGHLYVVYVALSACCLAVSAMCNRRGVAAGICFVAIFYCFVINFLAELWEPAKRISWTSFLHYYRPLPIVRAGSWQVREIAILLSVAAAFWMGGLLAWTRRDIPAR